MLFLGIDPGLTRAGIGVIESTNGHHAAKDWLTIETDDALPLPDRLRELGNDLRAFLDTTHPDLAIVEELFFATNKQTAMRTAAARGVILYLLADAGIPIITATPLQLKMAITGDGQADKKQMQTMVQRILKLTEIPTPADAADGLGLALYGAFTHQFDVSLHLPTHQRA